METAMNRHLLLSNNLPVKLEYASLTYQVEERDVGKSFYVFFRALNFTEEQGNEGCSTLFIEAEFAPFTPQCLHNPELSPSTETIKLEDSQLKAVAHDIS